MTAMNIEMKKWQPKRPKDGDWTRVGDPRWEAKLQGEMYVSPLGIRVVSSVHIVENANKEGVGPHFHISISDNGERVAASIVPTILRQFGAEDFEEDNHAPMKKIRSFWRPIGGEPTECACKANEKPEVHGDYVWRQE